MSASPSSVLLFGMGPQSAGLIITLGFGSGVSHQDTHDGGYRREDDEAFAKRDDEIRNARAALRAQLLAAVERVTGKPPSLDASPKQLASIARKSESFDYASAISEIARLDAEARALREDREGQTRRFQEQQIRMEQERKTRELKVRRRQEEEALLTLLLH